MKFLKHCVSFLVLCVLFANNVRETRSMAVHDQVVNGGLTAASATMDSLASGPLGAVIDGVFWMTTAFQAIAGNSKSGENKEPSTNDLLNSQKEISRQMKNLESHLSDVYNGLIFISQTNTLFDNMRNDLDYINKNYDENMDTVLDNNVVGETKKKIMVALLNMYSIPSHTLKSFITRYIKPNGAVSAAGEVNLLFDHVVKRDQTLATTGDDCHMESTHNKIYNSFVYIFITLTKGYLLTVTAHIVQYQKEFKANKINEVTNIKTEATKILIQYKNDMHILMDKTKWALENSSRQIRNCGQFELKQGETFDRLSFAHILPKFVDWTYDKTRKYSMYKMPQNNCYRREVDVNFDDVVIQNCTKYNFSLPGGFEVYVNASAPYWPYTYMKHEPMFSPQEVIGHPIEGDLIVRQYLATPRCISTFCTAFKKNVAAISTKLVPADPQYFITGARLRVTRNILHIQIQQGKILPDLTIDPETVMWKLTTPNYEVEYLNSTLRNINLGSVQLLNKNTYLTTVQLKVSEENNQFIGIHVSGSYPFNTTISDTMAHKSFTASRGIPLNNADDPSMMSADVKNLVSKAPDANAPYHISFQHSDLAKDMGRSTIPLIDTRPVVADPPVPLQGIGFHHLGSEGSGGYLSLHLLDNDKTQFVDKSIIKKTTELIQL